jgi:hypothetical protein
MNSLSLIIYGISTLLQLTVFLQGVIAMTIVAAVLCLLIFLYLAMEGADTLKEFATPLKWFKRTIITGAVAAFLLVFLPNQKFLVLIAASEVGEMAMNQPAVQNAVGQIAGLSADATNLLKLYIESETKKFMEEMKPSEKK